MRKLILDQPGREDENDFIFSLNDKRISQLEWEGDDEFGLNGEMYDVIEKKTQNNRLIIRALADKKETALLRKYADMSREDHSKSKSALLLKLIGGSYVVTPCVTFFTKVSAGTFKQFFQSQIISALVHDVLTPPPQVI